MPLPGTGVTASASSIVARPDAGSVAAAADEKERSTLSKSSTTVCGVAGVVNNAAANNIGFKNMILATPDLDLGRWPWGCPGARPLRPIHCLRSEEHTSELQSLMRISYAVFCLKKKKKNNLSKKITNHKHT